MRQLLVVAILVVLIAHPSARAEVPSLIRYQGQAVDTNEVPLEGPYTLKFRLYNAETAGIVVWEEIQPNVSLSKGHFSVLLGSVTPLNGMDWAQPCWLSVQVNGDPELAPRQRITSVPLALRAKTAEIVKTSGLTDDENSLVPTGAIILWNSATCPAGYTRLSTLDGKFLSSGTTYTPSAGGSNSVTPSGTISAAGDHAHTIPIDGYANGGNPSFGGGSPSWLDNRMAVGGAASEHNLGTALSTPQSGPAGAHTHTFAGSPFDNRPEFAVVLLCQKD